MTHEEQLKAVMEQRATKVCEALQVVVSSAKVNVAQETAVMAGRRLERILLAAEPALEEAKALQHMVRQLDPVETTVA